MRLNDKIAEILKQHPEGEQFFNALDAMVRGDLDILDAFMSFVYSRLPDPKKYSLVLTGQFGNAIMGIYGLQLFEKFADVIPVEGGLRNGKKPVIFRQRLKTSKFIMLDDSFYSGTTRDAIECSLSGLDRNANIEKTFVIYDGSKNKSDRVLSMFRYYDHFDCPVILEDIPNSESPFEPTGFDDLC